MEQLFGDNEFRKSARRATPQFGNQIKQHVSCKAELAAADRVDPGDAPCTPAMFNS
jgi:hypothetical protein